MIEIYIYGCICGVNGALVRKVKHYAKSNNLQVKVHQTKYSKSLLEKHLQLLKDNNLSIQSYLALVIYNNEVKLLRSWNF